MHFNLYIDINGQWRWSFISSGNGRKIANSGEGYYNKADCIHAINLVRGSGSAPIRE